MASPTAGQSRSEITAQTHLMITTARPGFLGGGVGLGFRSAGHLGGSVLVTAGDRLGRTARLEGLVSFRFDPSPLGPASAYGVGGLAVETSPATEYLVVAFGVETTKGRGTGWFAEIGVGGGIRLVAGFRVRPGPGR